MSPTPAATLVLRYSEPAGCWSARDYAAEIARNLDAAQIQNLVWGFPGVNLWKGVEFIIPDESTTGATGLLISQAGAQPWVQSKLIPNLPKLHGHLNLPAVDDPVFMLTNSRTFPVEWGDHYPVMVLTVEALAESLNFLLCRDFFDDQLLFARWLSMLKKLAAKGERPMRPLNPEFEDVLGQLVMWEFRAGFAGIVRLRERLVREWKLH
ncbi:hypothetical protein BJY04DRAFT_223143 [Aspergillus karnatakaensis]|uniref:uncharacterized protein n=1 Tax=Aspergillus karnatakaensis TaxID=1810916 RepID=UPI003CCE2C38